MAILITGARGFVGSALIDHCRAHPRDLTSRVVQSTQRLNKSADFSNELKGVDVVIHLAARVHLMVDSAQEPLEEYRAVNVDGTRTLVQQAVAAGVKRFIYLSSVKVNGEQTPKGRPFTEEDIPMPMDPYGVSKWEAERCLRAIAEGSKMEVVIIRSPLVYGPGVRANFAALIRLVRRGLPLPFGSLQNRRSFIALGNLVDFVDICMTHPAAANQIFFVSDGYDISTTQLVRGLAQAMRVPDRLIPVPVFLLNLGGVVSGKSEAIQRLCGDLQVDISKAQRLLAWTPPITFEEGLQQAVNGDAE